MTERLHFPFTFLSQVVLMVENLPANAGNIRDASSIPGLARLPGGGHGNPPQYACLGNPMDKEAWQTTVHRGHKNMDMTWKLNNSNTCMLINMHTFPSSVH